MEIAYSDASLATGIMRETALRSAESALVLATVGNIAICLFLPGTHDETETDDDRILRLTCTLDRFTSLSRSSTPHQSLPLLL